MMKGKEAKEREREWRPMREVEDINMLGLGRTQDGTVLLTNCRPASLAARHKAVQRTLEGEPLLLLCAQEAHRDLCRADSKLLLGLHCVLSFQRAHPLTGKHEALSTGVQGLQKGVQYHKALWLA